MFVVLDGLINLSGALYIYIFIDMLQSTVHGPCSSITSIDRQRVELDQGVEDLMCIASLYQ